MWIYKSGFSGNRTKQSGAALVWGLAILLSLTVFGETAARMGVVDNRIAGNEIAMMMTYQTTESQLNRVRPPLERLAPDGSLSYIKLAMDNSSHRLEIDGSSSLLLESDGMQSKVVVEYGDKMSMCMPQEGYAMRMEMTQDVGGFDCHGFVVKSGTTIPGNGAHSNHEVGLMHYLPAQGNNPG